MKAVIISIGDEILNGTTINTNASWISTQIQPIGIDIHEVVAISDNAIHILHTLETFIGKVDIILITGGLGPTKDDITKKTICSYFKSELVFHQEIYARLKAAFEKRNIPFTENNRDQAMYPDNCTILDNPLGTAQGMWFEKNDTVIACMPGVPFEMKGLMTNQVIPKIMKRFNFPAIVNKYFMTSGISESFLANKLEPLEALLPEHITLAYLPTPAVVKLRLTARGEDENLLEQELSAISNQMRAILGAGIYAEEPIPLEQHIGNQLRMLKATLATAESITGGKVAHKITLIPGSSDYFRGAVVAYHQSVKQHLLKVSTTTLENFTPVSEETAVEMLDGIISALGTDFGIAITGNAGPTADGKAEDVGTVFIAVGSKTEKRVKKHFFNKNREVNIEYASMFSLHELRILLTEYLVKA
ncbi:MAG TPA: CinA family nicotinamide mononucleotide deamidase-related protein [Chitinophagales bacterium]|nr:CinA family nicotinamide mononucleotide deamidase-related protein [Chitinophagales bacterium]HRG84225.1 CinA family nicotinamide mononucleotide deamidase-related protein [Chitinophagales bacterium]HRH52108.1 CinA family nicotinamide mononucleotide deamidase-related protein [Chitinophagales bacterium]